MSEAPLYLEVVLPNATARGWTYSAPESARPQVVPGARVRVRFAGRLVVGYVVRAGVEPPEGVKVSPIEATLDEEEPTFSPRMVEFVQWVARYYRAAPGEVFRGAHPVGTNEQSVRWARLTDEGGQALAADGLEPTDVARLTTLKGGPLREDAITPAASDAVLKRLARLGWVVREVRVEAPRVAVKTERCVQAMAPAPVGARARKRDALVAWLVGRGAVPVREVRAEFPQATPWIRELVDEGVLAESQVEVIRDPFFGEAVARDTPPALNAAQRRAVATVLDARGYRGYLLHGITGSGKTEVYLHIIEAALARGQGALVLVPEIALTPQLVRRFRARLGDAIAVLHSGLSDGARYDQWRRLRRGEVRVAIGARSGLFAPVRDLGVIVVDEEHDPSFKQGDGVRYHARDMALVRGHLEGAVVVLGSATPSLESTWNASQGKLERLVLAERPTGGRLPEVTLVDLRVERPLRDSAPFLSVPLRNALAENLGRGEQSILFLNRRGHSSFVQCKGCGEVLECAQCAVAFTWHSGPRLLRCHYCDAVRGLPGQCPACARPQLELLGAGTEKVEEGLQSLFPAARIARLDRDTAVGRGLESVLRAMREGQVDILVGTQMVTKGHDFPRVTLVGVLAADAGLAFPDFRAGERTFQLLAQVAGRAGRGQRPGRVIIQTRNPEHPCLAAAARHDHAAFCAGELELRRALGYPPCGYAAAVRVDGTRADDVERVVREVAATLERAIGAQRDVVLRGPAPSPLVRLRGRTRWSLLLTAARRAPLRRVLDALDEDAPNVTGDLRWHVDVDPQDFL